MCKLIKAEKAAPKSARAEAESTGLIRRPLDTLHSSALMVATEAVRSANKMHYLLGNRGTFCTSDWKEHMTQESAKLIATQYSQLQRIDQELLIQHTIDVTKGMNKANLMKWFRSVRGALGR